MSQDKPNERSTAESWRPATSEIPTSPGVYRFLDGEGRVIYVGKAKNLRNRLVNYFQDPRQLHPRTAQMVRTARSVQWTIVATEIEALTLEFQWINEFDPRFNVIFRDDKSYPYLSVSMGEKFPRVAVSREAKKRGTVYFGPYAKVWAIRETIDELLGTFPMRTCSAGVFNRAHAQGRPCLLGHISRCAAPCVGWISEEEHRKMAEDLCAFMEGKTAGYIAKTKEEMLNASANQDYELAAKKRDALVALEKIQERNTIVLPDGTDADLFALVADDLDVAVHAFYIRGGRIRGTRGWVMERGDSRGENEFMADLLRQVYAERSRMADLQRMRNIKERPVSVDDVSHHSLETVPREILVSHRPADQEVLEKWLAELRGAQVLIKVPQRGAKADLLDTVGENARHSLAVYKTRRAGDISHRTEALRQLQEALELERPALRIESFDISHTAGSFPVASMVVFEDGAPKKSDYRIFNINRVEGEKADDTAAMNEVLTRRFKRLQEMGDRLDAMQQADLIDVAAEDLVSGEIDIDADVTRPARFAYRPDLIVVDGGLPQVNAAQEAIRRTGADIPVVGLAKRLEEVWVPGREFPVILPRTSAALYLLQHLRDESHRFAITKHRAKRTKGQTRSVLDAIPGLGQSRQRALLRAFSSVKRIKAASVQELQEVETIGPHLAEQIYQHLHPAPDAGNDSTK